MATKTAEGLVKHVKKCLEDGWGYVYGALGQVCTKSLLDSCAERYPANNLAGGAMREAGEKWLGKHVADCSGMIKAYLMSDYTGGPIKYDPYVDSSVHYNRAKEKGPISTMPDVPGIIVYMPGHVGVYIGNGQVIESAGTLYGVKKSTVKKSYVSGPWTHWYKCPGIEYSGEIEQPDEGSKPDTEEKPVSPSTSDTSVDVTYRVRTNGKWLPAVKNLTDYAGLIGKAITDVAIKVSKGKIKYRVHVKGGSWLPMVTGYDINDHENGYAGDKKAIDAIEAYYYTPDDIRPYKKAKYRVAPLKDNYYSWQYDNETTNNQDGYAGAMGVYIDRFQIAIE